MQAPDDTRQPRAATGVGTDKCARGSRGYAAGGPDPRRAHRAGADDRDRATLDAAGDGAAFRGQAADELGGAASVHARRRQLDLLRRKAPHDGQPFLPGRHEASPPGRRSTAPTGGSGHLMELGLQARSGVGPAADWAEDELRALERQRLRRHLEPLESPQGAVVKLAGIELINFSSNDYLGLANDPAVIDAASSAVHRFGVGSGADSESVHCAAGCVNHRWIVRQTQIVVGRKVDQLNSGELNDSTLGRFERLEMAAKPLPF